MSTFLQPPPKPQPPPNNPGGGVFDDFPVDRQSCQLLGPTALVVQGLMGMVVITSLLLKRHREKPKRPWRIWLFDVSKQVVGQMFVHGVNVLISDVGSTRSSRNACVFYFINILIDTTLGVGAIYLTLHFLTWFFTEKLQLRGFQSGQYGSPPSLNYWLRQAVVYVVSLTSMKLLVVLLLAYWHGLVDIGVWLLSWLGNGNTAQVVFTMGLFPIFMNVVQFWLIDSIVKAGGIVGIALPIDSSDGTDGESLFYSSNDPDLDDRLNDDDNDNDNNNNDDGDDDDDDDDDEDSIGDDAITSMTKRDIEAQGPSQFMRRSTDSSHTYPPSLSSSPTALPTIQQRTSISPPAISRVLSARRRRSPPAPLVPRSPMAPALNSADRPSKASAGVRIGNRRASSHMSSDAGTKEDWQMWEGEEDWANRVGEEDWTGRRAEARKGEVDNVWRGRGRGGGEL